MTWRTYEGGLFWAMGCVVLVLLAVLLGLVFDYFLAWLIVAVLAGFGVSAPFWPTFGAIIVFQTLVGIFRSNVAVSR